MMSQPRPVVIGDRILPGGEQHDPGTWTPWLLIRFATNDAGARSIANGTVFWLSPDIAVDSSDPWGNAVAGEENFVEARIFNLGKAPAIPTVAVPAPDSARFRRTRPSWLVAPRAGR